jgi:hypothetical protein
MRVSHRVQRLKNYGILRAAFYRCHVSEVTAPKAITYMRI